MQVKLCPFDVRLHRWVVWGDSPKNSVSYYTAIQEQQQFWVGKIQKKLKGFFHH